MPFVHPLLLFGLVLVGIPVMLHLIMRQKPKHLMFPALRFLLARHRSNQRKLHLRHLVLLALRILLIVAVCLALARPKIFSERLNLTANRPVGVVLVFDTSLSMEYHFGDQSRLDEARRRAQELLENLPEGSRVAILDTGETGGEWLPSISGARSKVETLHIRSGSGTITSQLTHGYDLLSQLEQEQENPEENLLPFLFVFSDQTQACWDPQQTASLKELHHGIATRTHSAFVDVGVEKPVDQAISNVEVERQIIPVGNHPAVIRATVLATGENLDTEIDCLIDNQQPADRQPLQLEVGKSQIVTFTRRGLPVGWHQAQVFFKAADRSLLFNNSGFVTFKVIGPRKVLIIADNINNAYLLKETLSVGEGFDCNLISTAETNKFYPRDWIRDYQAICLLSVANPAERNNDLWTKLDEYVRSGGGLAVLPGGEELDTSSYNNEVAQHLLKTKLIRPVVAAARGGFQWDWKDESEFKHPLMKPFKEWAQLADTDFIKWPPTTFRFWQVQFNNGEAEAVAHYNDKEKSPSLVEPLFDRTNVRGRVIISTTALDGRGHSQKDPRPPWNNYQEFTSFYLVVTQLAVGYLAGDAEEAQFNYLCGQGVPVPLPTTARFPTYTIQGPGLIGEEAIVTRPEDQNNLLLISPEKPGNYTLFGADGKPISFFSLHASPEESQLSRVPTEQIEDLFGPGAVLRLSPKSNFQEAIKGHWTQPVELLPLMLILLLLFLALENLLANKFYRRESVQDEDGGIKNKGQETNIKEQQTAGLQ